MKELWICAEPCGLSFCTKKDWDEHLLTAHKDAKLCSSMAPFFTGFAMCNKWHGHEGKHKALNYEWEESDDCWVCGQKQGANEAHWRQKHANKTEQ